MEMWEPYTIKGETVEQSITMDSLIYGSGSQTGGRHGNDGGDRGSMAEDGMRGGYGKGQDREIWKILRKILHLQTRQRMIV